MTSETGWVLRAAADQLDTLATRTTGGDWRLGGLLATRPEIIAVHGDGRSEHVAEARANSARWIAVLSPEVAPALATWLRATARGERDDLPALDFAAAILERMTATGGGPGTETRPGTPSSL